MEKIFYWSQKNKIKEKSKWGVNLNTSHKNYFYVEYKH